VDCNLFSAKNRRNVISVCLACLNQCFSIFWETRKILDYDVAEGCHTNDCKDRRVERGYQKSDEGRNIFLLFLDGKSGYGLFDEKLSMWIPVSD
jgi:hypothetical protein